MYVRQRVKVYYSLCCNVNTVRSITVHVYSYYCGVYSDICTYYTRDIPEK